jgi:hypothetical protein
MDHSTKLIGLMYASVQPIQQTVGLRHFLMEVKACSMLQKFHIVWTGN